MMDAPAIRQAVLADRFQMIRLGRKFLEASGEALPFDPAYAENTAKLYIGDDDRLALVMDAGAGPVGLLLAFVCWHELAPLRVAQERLWWIEPAYRGHGRLMIDAYRAWAQERGADLFGLSARDERVGRLYGRLGLKPAESSWMGRP